MDELLELSIILTSPPPDAPPEVIASVALHCDTLGLSCTGKPLVDPLTTKERALVKWYLEEYWLWPFEGFLERGRQVQALLPQIGKRLYRAVFGSVEAQALVQKWWMQSGLHPSICIMSEIPGTLSLPWELLHDAHDFLALRSSRPISIVRRLPQQEQSPLSTSFEPPLRILLITARPTDEDGLFPFIDSRSIARGLIDETQSQVDAGTIELEILRPPTLQALRTRLEDHKRPIHILHFDGHGMFGQEMNTESGPGLGYREQGMLAFENDKGKYALVKGEELANILRASKVRLVVLNACQSAVSTADDAFSSVAAQLIRGGVGTVIAMSASFLVTSAARYVKAFYRALSAGTSVPAAQDQARRALYEGRRYDLGKAGEPVEVHDWWIPHFYQQRSLELHPIKSSRESSQRPMSLLPRLSENMPAKPRHGFYGRARELLIVERLLMRGKLVAIHGFGGVGKTAFVREVAHWLTRTRMFDEAHYISFEHGGDAAMLLRRLPSSLRMGSNNELHGKVETLAQLEVALKKKHILVIADHLESILPRGKAPLDTAERDHLWDVLLELRRMGAGVILVSRSIALGDGKLAASKWVVHQELKGLLPEDALALLTHLLSEIELDRAQVPFLEVHDLLVQLDYHPLAIQLVFLALRKYPLTRIRADFVELLSEFVDSREQGRNRSLLDSLDYSLQRLSEEQRSLLPLLVLFQGGAYEFHVLRITELSKTEWAKLSTALEEAALLRREYVDESLFLHFHPILTPYLRSLAGADNATLRERYARFYHDSAGYLYERDLHNARWVHAQVEHDLPNLRRAMEVLLETGDLEKASNMAICLTKFLTDFGLLQERDALQRRIAEFMSVETQESGILTSVEFWHEHTLGKDELDKGQLGAAFARFTALLERIETLRGPESVGRGSYQHCLVLHELALCLYQKGDLPEAEKRLREALAVIDALLTALPRSFTVIISPVDDPDPYINTPVDELPEKQNRIYQRGLLLTDLGTVLCDREQYTQAQELYEEVLKITDRQGDLRGLAVVLQRLGDLALRQKDYTKAHSYYAGALLTYQELGKPTGEANAWRQLGQVAWAQGEWAEAERYYRESLVLEEQADSRLGVARSYYGLALTTRDAGHLAEAESWLKRALEVIEQVCPGSDMHAACLTELAALLKKEGSDGRTPAIRLTQARDFAEQSLSIMEAIGASEGIWRTLGYLADIADSEGRTEAARVYHRRERETYAASVGNRDYIDRLHGRLIPHIAAAATGDKQARAIAEADLPRLEAKGWYVTTAARRIWAGERDWYSLTEYLHRDEALLVLHVLESVAQPTKVESSRSHLPRGRRTKWKSLFGRKDKTP